jgi:Flp pilus assembly protein TadB
MKNKKKKLNEKKINEVDNKDLLQGVSLFDSIKTNQEKILDKIKEDLEKDNKIKESTKSKKFSNLKVPLFFSLLISIGNYFLFKGIWTSIALFIGVFLLAKIYFVFNEKLLKIRRVKKIEEVFPDFIELMSSNLRAGMTTDRALVLSARKEFSPLDKEIILMGKDIMAGKEISRAMSDMAERINSDIIRKTVTVINSGIKSGGNLAVLLEQTAINMREKQFIEKKSASNVLMYQIFIFFAVGVGAPALFSLSSVLVSVLTSIVGDMPEMDSSVGSMPVTLSQISISTQFVGYYSLLLLVAMGILASLLLGLVNKGEEKEGLKYMAPILAISISIYFLLRYFLLRFFSGMMG